MEISTFVKLQKQAGKPFIDPDFPPIRKSIYRHGDPDTTEKDLKFYEKLEWKRLGEIYPE